MYRSHLNFQQQNGKLWLVFYFRNKIQITKPLVFVMCKCVELYALKFLILIRFCRNFATVFRNLKYKIWRCAELLPNFLEIMSYFNGEEVVFIVQFIMSFASFVSVDTWAKIRLIGTRTRPRCRAVPSIALRAASAAWSRSISPPSRWSMCRAETCPEGGSAGRPCLPARCIKNSADCFNFCKYL